MSDQRYRTLVNELDGLLQARFHGAANITGIRFQVLYSVLRLFDLFTTAEVVQFEGLEDLDVRGRSGDIYFQAKSSRSKQGWGWLRSEKVLDHFAEVYKLTPESRFVVVINFETTGLLKELENFCSGAFNHMPREVGRKLNSLANQIGLAQSEIEQFVGRVSFARVSEENLIQRTRANIIRYFDVTAGNEDLYLSHLTACALDWARQRSEIGQRELESARLLVQDLIALGPVNPAVRDGLIVPLTFAEDSSSEDYYEGKQARPGHILANLDAPRPTWLESIEQALSEAKVCVVRASSGQGKSTLAYRYAFEHYVPGAIYRLRACSTDGQVGQIASYLRTRLTLGLPLLILLDNLSYSTRLWHQVVAELGGEEIRFLVTSRQEDWYRYGFGAASFRSKAVEPTLSLSEARSIFAYFRERNKIASGMPSAEWAYEQVADKKLLIEFVYLVTHGQMLFERLEEQIRTIEQQNEDSAKIDVIRLISTAQRYGARVSVKAILNAVPFREDPQRILRSLQGEYIECHDGECDGLHFVRSDHLMGLLHMSLPLEHTLERLVAFLDHSNLTTLVSSAFSDPTIETEELLPVLVERCRGTDLAFVNSLLDALYVAGEARFIQANQNLFDAAFERMGSPALLMLTASSAPSGKLNIVQQLLDLFPDNPGMNYLQELLPQFRSREDVGSRETNRRFLQEVLPVLTLDGTTSLAELAKLSNWCLFLDVSAPSIDQFFDGDTWMYRLLISDGATISSFLNALHNRSPQRHQRLIDSEKSYLWALYKYEFDVLTIEERDHDIFIEFVVDESEEAGSSNEQAVSRLQQLRQWYPIYGRYCSQGLYSSTAGTPPEVDNSHKAIPGETLDTYIHSDRNATYSRLVENRYAASLLYDWTQRWHELRVKSLRYH